ncbi:MAG: EamA family transporter RarD [Verrucomicrobiia bacterium]
MQEDRRQARTPSPVGAPPAAAKSGTGLAYGLAAYTIWGFIPVYFRAVAHVPPLTVLCHRIVWSAAFMAIVVSVCREWTPVLAAVRVRRKFAFLLTGATLIAANWLIFIYAVSSRQVLQASLGYFISPLLSVALGVVFLRERLRRLQWVAVLIAGFAVGNMAWQGAGFPWIAISLAATFGFYGLVRKKVDINSLHGLLIESVVLVPFAVAALAILPLQETTAGTLGLLSLSGIITAVPLLFFGAALRRLKLSTLGFLQYVGPTLQFLVATFLFGEALDAVKLVSFALCWTAIAVYVADSILVLYPQVFRDRFK